MKDRQIHPPPPQARIPLLSAALHCVSMPVIVLLRGSFGYAYLRPRSVFFAITWAFGLFTFYAWNEKEVRAEYWSACVFGLMAAGLYWAHLLLALFRELNRSGPHDNDSGTPHAMRILRLLRRPVSRRLETHWLIWGEPVLTASTAGFLRIVFDERHLSAWLLFTAVCLWAKESLNYWFQTRLQKRHRDSRDDAEELFDEVVEPDATEAPKAVGKVKVKRARMSSESSNSNLWESPEGHRCARILRLIPPFTAADAELNYKKLIRQSHPDTSLSQPNQETAAELNEAIAYFRRNPGGGSEAG